MKPFLPESFPTAFVDRYTALFGEQTMEKILHGYDTPRQTWFRINPLKVTIPDGWNQLRNENIPFSIDTTFEDAGWVEPENRSMLLESEAVSNGLVYVQGFASQLPVRFLEVAPGQTILDLTAAPGSKTLQIAGLASAEDEIAAVELVRKRKFKLQENLSRNGAESVRVFLQDGTKVWKYRPEYFDRVLLDAPCSSEGRFDLHDPTSYSFWTPSKVKEMVRKQRRLLFSAIHALKPGGTLVYSTCALSQEENEGAIEYVLNSFGECMEIEPIDFTAPERSEAVLTWRKKTLDARIAHAWRILPSNRMEGFFLCKMKKTVSSNPSFPGKKSW
jgi:16S rRNA C967 or C1407 C5-methylase (RsmB/RsmF family)